MACVESAHRRDLILLLFLGRADQLRPLVFLRRIGPGQEGIDADDRQRTVVFLRLVVERLLLDLGALVHGLHRTEHAATLRQRLELLIDRLLHHVRQVIDGERALPRFWILLETSSRLMIS